MQHTTFCIFAKSNPVVHPSIAKAAGAYVASYGLGLDIGAGSDSDERSWAASVAGLDIGAGSDSDERSWVAQSPAGYKNGISKLGLLKITNLKITKFRKFRKSHNFFFENFIFFLQKFQNKFWFFKILKISKIWLKKIKFSYFLFYQKKSPNFEMP